MATDYSHDQLGTLTITMIVPIVVLLVILYAATGFMPLLVVMVVAFVLLLALFYRLRVEVTSEALKLAFGIGLVRKSFSIAEIVDAYPVRNKWWYGFGIRLTPHGWLFNISGLDAVEIVMRSGRSYRIGSPEPEALTRSLRRVAGIGA